jgi:hypothetical protein
MLHKHAGPAVAGNYLVGAISGALVTASALLLMSGLVSPLPDQLRAGAALCLLALLALRVVGVLCLDLPQRQVQIPRETFNQSPQRAAFRFAFELGTGVRTYITATAPYALAIVLVLCVPANLSEAVLATTLAALGYGLGRSLVIVSQTVLRRPPIEHPGWALRIADIIAVATAAVLAVQHLIQL